MRIGFLGDTSFTGVFAHARQQQPCWQAVQEILADNHYNVVNLEGPLTENGFQKKKGAALRSTPGSAEVLNRIGTNVLNLANNHTMDCGPAGLDDTLAIARKHEWQTFGAGRSLAEAGRGITLSDGELRVALIGVCHKEGPVAKHDTAGIFCDEDRRLMRARLASLKETHDWVVLNYHGGEEFTFLPMPRRMRQLKKYLDWGADIVVAHHPHVVQGYEAVGVKKIFYSLGNFIFDYEHHCQHEGTDESVIVHLECDKRTVSFDPIFTRISRENGTVEQICENHRFQPIPTRGYHRAWQADCCRLFFRRPVPEGRCLDQANSRNGSRNVTRVRGLAREAFRLRNYFGLAKVLRSRNSRPLFIAAVLGLIRRKLGLT